MPASLLNNINAIVHIGAGRGRELNDYLASPAQQIILVEPNPRLVAELRRLGEADARIRVVEAAVSNSSADNLLQEYNLPDVNSLYTATGLRQLFPGLRLLGQLPVSTLTGQELLDHCALEGEDNTLIIEAPGAELAIIETLTEAGGIDKFSRIAINCAEEPLYDSPSHAGAVLKLLQEQGFDLVHRDDTDPDWPNWVLHRNALKQKFTAVTMQYQTVSMDLKTTRKELEEWKTRAAIAKDALATRDRQIEIAAEKQAATNQQLEQARTEAAQRIDAERQHSKQLQEQLHEAGEQLKVEKEKRQHAQTARQYVQADKEKAEEQIKLEKAKTKNLEAQLSSTQAELKASNEKRQKLESDRKFAKASDEEQIKQLKNLEQQVNDARAELKASKEQQERAETARKKAEARADAAEEQLRSLATQKESEQQGTKEQELKKLEKRMEYFFEQQRLQMEQAANALGRHITTTVTNTAKDLEAGIALQQQYGQDLPSLEDQNGRLPPSVALQLSRQLRTQPYDVIIELGSGVTTTFMAHTLRNHTGKSDEPHSGEKQVAHYVDASEDDLPKRIVCFEHKRKKYLDLQKTLQKTGLAPMISMQFAPLVNISHQEQDYLFYDCATRLQQLAKLFDGREARIFILVNQINGDNSLSLIPAMTQILQFLAAHQLDIVAPWKDEGLVRKWKVDLIERGLEYNITENYCGGAAHHILVNP